MDTLLISNHVAITRGVREHDIPAEWYPSLDVAVAAGVLGTAGRVILDVTSLDMWAAAPPETGDDTELVLAFAGGLPTILARFAARVGAAYLVDVTAGEPTRWHRLI